MPTQDAAFSSPADEPRPFLPYPNLFELPEEGFRRLQELLEQETGHPWRPIEAKLLGVELLELTVQLVDSEAWY